MANPYHLHREQQVAHRRVATLLKDYSGGTKHADKGAFSNVTSKTAAACHDGKVEGKSSPKRYARGGKVGGTTNIIIASGSKEPQMPMGMPMGGPPPGPPPGGPPMGPPPGGPPPGMPMRAKGGRIKAGAETGVGRLQKAKQQRGK
jgi:hypothetical protein